MAASAGLARARSQGRLPRIGVLFNSVPTEELVAGTSKQPSYVALMEGLREKGWIPGKNVELVWRSAESDSAKFPEHARDLAARCDLIIVFGGPAVRAAVAATTRVPIVLAASNVGGRVEVEGVVRIASLAKPGGNVTGMSTASEGQLTGKRLEFMKLAAPRIRRVGFLGHDPPPNQAAFPRTQDALEKLGLEFFPYSFFSSIDRLAGAFDAMVRDRIDAVLVSESPANSIASVQAAIHRLAERHRLVAMHSELHAADSGGLMSYGADVYKLTRRATSFVDRILRGAKPGDLPIEQTTEFELRVNLKAARAIGITLPRALLVQAARVIE